MIDLTEPVEKVVLVAAPRRGSRDVSLADDHLDELERLTDTAGGKVVARMVQRVEAPNPATYIGEGKVDELAGVIQSSGATLVVFDEELAPVQGKNLEAQLKTRVMDRAELILDIFARRARSNEARMQIELAQLEYLLPRLARMWAHLSRIRGGIGLRGPGETQIETDRRLIRTKISQLKRRLEKAERHRETLRAGRRSILTAALVGYTNAGKSSLLRALTGADAFVEDRLFATLDTLVREFSAGGSRIRVIDTVGFIRKLPHHLVASFRSTLEEARYADVLVHVVDASNVAWEEQVEAVNTVLEDLGLGDRPRVLAFNKMDAVAEPETFRASVALRFPGAVFVSAARGDVASLVERLASLRGEREFVADPRGEALS